jgi:hypothetical protein
MSDESLTLTVPEVPRLPNNRDLRARGRVDTFGRVGRVLKQDFDRPATPRSRRAPRGINMTDALGGRA